MVRYKCILAYDGYNYMGFQIQNDLPTIELEINKAMYKMLNKDVKIYPSGRTDRYVHARAQVIHFDLDNYIEPNSLKRGINTYLPADIYIKSVEEVDLNFHARFSAKSKEYRYYINTLEYNPFTARYSSYIYNLDFNKMKEAINLFVGTHDFKGFASAQIDERKDTVKTIFEAKLNELDGVLEFVFIGTGFLKYQVRKMVGILINIGSNKANREDILKIFETGDTKINHMVADGCGLFLEKVNY